MPLRTKLVPTVVMNGLMPTPAIRIPLTAPIAKPTAIAARKATIGGWLIPTPAAVTAVSE